MRFYLQVFIVFFFGHDLLAQPFGVNSGVQYSYSGFNLTSGLSYKINNSEIGAGIKKPISYTTNRLNGALGAVFNYTRFFDNGKRLTPFAQSQYEITFFKPVYHNGTANAMDKIHELYLTYGLKFQMFRSLSVSNGIGTGLFYEDYTDSRENEKIYNWGMYTQLYIKAAYTFK